MPLNPKDLFKAILGGLGLRLVGMLLAFIASIQIARWLGLNGFGIYSTIISISAIILALIEFGMPQLLVKESAGTENKEKEKILSIHKASIHISLLTGAAITTLALIYSALNTSASNAQNGLYFAFAAVIAIFTALSNLDSAILRGTGHMNKGQLSDTIIRPGLLVIFVFIISELTQQTNALHAIYATIVAAATSAAATRYFLHANKLTSNATKEKQQSKSIWIKKSTPYGATQLMHTALGHLPFILLAALTTPASTGAYKLAASLIFIVGIPTTVTNMIAAPHMAKLYSENKIDILKKITTKITISLTAASSIIAIFVIFLGEHTINLFFGSEFSSAYTPLLILCLGFIAYSTLGPGSLLLSMCNHQKVVTSSFGASLMVLIALGAPLIYLYGETGAAFASVVASSTSAYLTYRFALTNLDINTSILNPASNPK